MKKINKLKSNYIAIVFVLILGVFMMILPRDNSHNDDISDSGATLVLETRISQMLKDTYSIDKASVILTYDTTGEKIYNHENDSDLLMKKDELMVKSEKFPYVRGALIPLNNISPETSEKIREAIAVLLGVSKEKVIVIYDQGV